jgi:ribosomal protein S18 acetylase RimI-like enzyme
MVESLIHLPPQHARQAAQVLGRAFHNDPMSKYLVPDDAKRARLLPIFFSIQVRYCLRYGEVYTMPGLDGVACWLSPGATGPTIGRLSRIALRSPGIRRVPFELGLSGLRRYMDAERYTGDMHKRAAPGPHWYLWIIGVEPACQGKGIGGLLMQPILSRASAQGLPCYLETNNADNVPFYQKYGFRVVSDGEIPERGLRVWAMLRS